MQQILADPDSSDENKRAYEQWVKQRGPAARRRPWFHGDPTYADWVLPNHPVIGVSWSEAMAFCGWLTTDLHRRGLLGADHAIRLPTEVQWERAARGPERRRWPWGDAWQDDAANTGQAGLAATSAVGLFPFPADGPRDLAGNVWEWTATRWGRQAGKPAYRWPLDAADSRDDPTGADLRIMRGGSWYQAPRFCRAACRGRFFPDNWGGDQGFRVVRVSPG
ncbi:MAG TPA: SUMF1/EgtB/PvdO family nonheme iron enzyme [Lamprocystis sp. (in: g-proteobacteria)]|nr:SUMF1/EgtB/PvdO family nonheme iron enzyme [Lamprocystis sp. (in: g-proteobacteria)]